MDFYQILGSVAGVVGVGVCIPQAFRLYQLKQSKDVSLSMFITLSFVQFMWMVYGLHLQDRPIWLSNFAALLVTLTNIFLILRYRNGEGSN